MKFSESEFHKSGLMCFFIQVEWNILFIQGGNMINKLILVSIHCFVQPLLKYVCRVNLILKEIGSFLYQGHVSNLCFQKALSLPI